MKKKIFMIGACAFACVAIASCGGVTTKTSSSNVETSAKPSASSSTTPVVPSTTKTTDSTVESYTMNVYDLDGECLGTRTIPLDKYASALEALKHEFTVVSSSSGWGEYITSINGSIVDSSWSIKIYENGKATDTGIDGVVLDADDVFDFKVECWNTLESGWGTFDDYDILVDKAIYHYTKTGLKTSLQNATSYRNLFWEFSMISKMEAAGYSIFDFDDVADNVKSSYKDVDVSSLKGAEFYKYYRAYDILKKDVYTMDEASFKEVYAIYLNSITEYGTGKEYEYPFSFGMLKTFGFDVSDDVKNTTYRAATGYGPDGLSWQLTGLAGLTTLDSKELNALTYDTLANTSAKDVSISSMLLPYAAMNVSPRGNSFHEEKDILEVLFDDYYDTNAMKFAIEKKSSNMSSNQIYAALMMYKISRDLKCEANLFEC